MSFLRWWWCVFLVKNLGLEGYGRKFSHFTEEGRATLRDNVPLFFRITRKRRHSSYTVMPLDTEEDHAYSKRPYSFPSKELDSDVTMDKDAISLTDNISLKTLVERSQQSQHQQQELSSSLIEFFTENKGLLHDLKKSSQEKCYLLGRGQDDDQLDQVLCFLSEVFERNQTEDVCQYGGIHHGCSSARGNNPHSGSGEVSLSRQSEGTV
ncbi:uncharacterized protein LOC118302935 [Scophthalmus maximus]|uniref:uncharacterized protein LOC118302935 n=1 Tax=Scophthalmus maximus TaxID=52904 RepID=UPI001FA9134E|nr:uncharacterized protein LOC118302935 [Scophthalmus maximus]